MRRGAQLVPIWMPTMLKNTSTKHKKVLPIKKNSSILMIWVSRELFGRIKSFFLSFFYIQNKICCFRRQIICIYVGHSFFMKHRWTDFLNLCFSFEWRIVVLRVEKSNVLMILHDQSERDCMYFRIFQNPHLNHTTPPEASFTVTLKAAFDRW